MIQWSVRASRSLFAAVAVIVASLGVPGSARADLVTFNGDGNGQFQNYSFSGNPSLTGSFAGVLHMTDAFGNAFNAFCVDLLHTMSPGQSYNTTLGTNADVNNGNAIAYLANTYANNPGGSAKYGAANADEGESAVQLAIWGLEYGSTFSYSGPLAAEMAAFENEALTSGSTAAATFRLNTSGTVDTSDDGSGQGIVSPPSAGPVPVPEPSSLLLLSIGVVGLGTYRLRRRGSPVTA